MRPLPLLLAYAAWLAATTPAVSGEQAPRLLQVIVSHQDYHPFLPWQKGRPGTRAGYGVWLGKDMVITTEALVRNHTLVELRLPQAGEKAAAEVVIADPDVNLALLRLPASLNGDKLSPLHLAATMEPAADRIEILQFNENSEIQSGSARFLHLAMSPIPSAPAACLTLSLLTDLNVTGQGAPVLFDGAMAGLVMAYDAGKRTASAIPWPVIARFLDNVASPPYRGFASAGVAWSSLVDPAKRSFLKVHKPGAGILVTACLPGTGAGDALAPNDVIMAWDSRPIDTLGFYTDPDFGRLSFAYQVKGRRTPGDTVPVDIIREGRAMTVNVTLSRRSENDALIPENTPGNPQDFFVSGGLVLRELTGRYLRARGPNWMRRVSQRLTHAYLTRRDFPDVPGQRIVLLSAVLPDPINIGYQDYRDQIVTRVNGQDVAALDDVFRIIREDGQLERVSLQSMDVDLVLDQETLAQADQRIQANYRLPALSRHTEQPGRTRDGIRQP